MRQIILSLLLATTLVVSGCGSSSDSGTNDTSGGSTPGAVTGLVVTPGDGSNTLTWEAVEGAVSYEIYWSTDAGATGREAECDGNLIEDITGTNYLHSDLSNGVGYRYAVTAINGDDREGDCPAMSELFVPTPSGGGGGTPVYGCNHPDAINYDPSVTVYQPGSCRWPVATADTTPDTTRPTTTVALAEVSKTTSSWTGSATINENGIGYCTALTTGSPAPTAAEVEANNNANKAGTGGTVAMTANTTANCTVTGLTFGTTYDFYFVSEDTSHNLQANGAVSGPVTATLPFSATLTTQMAHGVSTGQIAWLVAKTNTNSTGYCVAVPQGGAAPTIYEIVAGSGGVIAGTQGTVALTAHTSGFCTVTGLTASTPYDLYFVAKDAGNALQESPTTLLNISTTASLGAAPGGMVTVLGGCFMMGDNLDQAGVGNTNERPVHPVCLSSYFMDITEVTQAAHTAWDDPGVTNRDTTFVAYQFPNGAACGGLASLCPAEKVDWNNASAFCAFYSKRLPTEAEWEYAARERGAVVRYGTGTDAITCNDANYSGCVGATQAVTKFEFSTPNALGLFDMSGNVSEWVADRYDYAYYWSSPITNPTGPGAGVGRVARGGSWGDGVDGQRASARYLVTPTYRGMFQGFRCASN